MKDRMTKRDTHTHPSHLLVHFPNDCSSQAPDRQVQEPGFQYDFHPVSNMEDRDPGTWIVFCCLPRYKEVHQKV